MTMSYKKYTGKLAGVITGYSGGWQLVSMCANCVGNKYKFTTGLTQGTEITKKHETSHAVSAVFGLSSTVEGGIKGIGSGSVTASAQLGYEFTHAQAQEFVNNFTQTSQNEREYECLRGALWQWVNNLALTVDGKNDVLVAKSNLLICTTLDDRPGKKATNINWIPCPASDSSGRWECKQSAAEKPAGSFQKDGNNGTVSCNTFCGKVKADGTPEWGTKTGACVEAINESTGKSIPCDAVPGLLQDGKHLTCFCNDSFKKDGNNGTVSCNTYCGAAGADGKPVWGDKIGYCVEAKNESTGGTVSCDTVPGIGKQLTCLCAPDVKIKHGDNGTVNCATYCFNYQSESHKQCVAAWNNVTKNNSDATCNHLPGLLNGTELTCTCR